MRINKKLRILNVYPNKGYTTCNFNYISIENLFWGQLKDHLISFSFNQLSSNLHFTIAFNQNSNKINLHLTKNVKDPLNKPKITILNITKELLIKVEPYFLNAIVKSFFEPIDINTLGNKTEIIFLPSKKANSGKKSKLLMTKLVAHLEPIIRIKSQRLKVIGSIEKQLEIFYKNQEDTLLRSIQFTKTNFQNSNSAVAKADDAILFLSKINGRWFKLTNKSLQEIMDSVLGEDLHKMINCSIKRAIIILKTATTEKETHHFKRTITIVRNPNITNEVNQLWNFIKPIYVEQ